MLRSSYGEPFNPDVGIHKHAQMLMAAAHHGEREDQVNETWTYCLAPHEDPHGLAREIRRVLELPVDDWSTLSQKAYTTAQQFDVKVSARKFERALESIVAEHGTPACGIAGFNAGQLRPPRRQVECGNVNTV